MEPKSESTRRNSWDVKDLIVASAEPKEDAMERIEIPALQGRFG